MLNWLQTAKDWIGIKSPPAPFLWSRGISQYCDYKGPDSYWRQPTESCQPETFFRKYYGDARGTVWLRLSTRARHGLACDLDNFVRGALPAIREPFALITTDGDVSVPADLAPETVKRLLDCPFLVAWYAQNCAVRNHAKIKPFPIGLDLHSRRVKHSPHWAIAQLTHIRAARPPLEKIPLRVFCDFSVNPRSAERKAAIAALQGCLHADFLQAKLSQAEIWRRYAQYPFVLSTEGNGLDCHRTWELLYLGCIVITRASPLDSLFEGLPVVIVQDWDEVRDPANLAKWLALYGDRTDADSIRRRLSPEAWIAPIRESVTRAQRSL